MTSEEGLSHAVRIFIREHIHSVADLDLLALVSSAPDRLWTLQALDRALRSNQQSLAQRLAMFVRNGLVEKDEAAADQYCYRPRDAALASAAAEAVREYRTRPVLVIETIFRPDSDAAQSFADAFRLRPPT